MWVAGARDGLDGGFKNKRGNCIDALSQVIGHSGLKPG